MSGDEFQQKLFRADTDAERAREFADQQDVIAGRETGRIKTNTRQNDDGGDTKARRKGKDTLEVLTNLQLLLQDTEYAALYRSVGELLGNAECETELALAAAEAELRDILSRSAKLPNGVAIFKDKDGNIRGADGKVIDTALAAEIVWPDDAPSYENYVQRRGRLDELRRYQVEVLGQARDRLEDHDDPPSMEELEDWERQIMDGAPEYVRSQIEPATPDERSVESGSLAVDAPKL
ncbi:MAG: hypothetical protein AAGD92_15195 [Pseudomonadota bacterium]